MYKLALYIHIPFCERKCLYCDFLSSYAENDVKERYIEALLKEISINYPMYLEYEITSVFIGGGTPSTLDASLIGKVLERIREIYDLSEDCEISIECNPGTLTAQKLSAYKEYGINRISLGLQSANDDELETLGRIHKYADFKASYDEVIKLGFNNVNVDIMYGIPFQTLDSYKRTLDIITNLNPAPKHISAYSLIVEEGTPFYESYGNNAKALPDEDTERDMDKMTSDILSAKGFKRYEISNYAKKGYECRHNKVYWQRGAYLGLGLGAASMVDNIRWKNTADLSEYLSESYKKEEYHILSPREQMEEYMFLGLRMTDGISISEFEKSIGASFPKKYWEIIYNYENIRLIDIDEKGDDIRVKLTDKGRDVSNTILADFLF